MNPGEYRAPRVDIPTVPERDYNWLETDDAVRRFLDEALAAWQGAHALHATAISTRLRLGELCGLRWSDISDATGLIRVCRSWNRATTKTSKIRRVPSFLNPALPDVLRAWKAAGTGEGLVFPNGAGAMWDSSGPPIAQEIFHRTLERAKLKRLHFHELRHTWASHCVKNGMDLFTLQKLGGWASQNMVQKYAHLAPGAFEKYRGIFAAPEAPPADGSRPWTDEEWHIATPEPALTPAPESFLHIM